MSAGVQALLSRLAGISTAIGVGGWVLSESLYNVDGGHNAIIWHRFNGGVQKDIIGEGTHFRASPPFALAAASPPRARPAPFTRPAPRPPPPPPRSIQSRPGQASRT